jgi:N-acetylglutamate synthase
VLAKASANCIRLTEHAATLRLPYDRPMSQSTPAAQARFLDELALRDWPAFESADIDGWLARAAAGVTRRSNSVWTHGSLESGVVAAKLDEAEAFYRDRELPPAFYVSPGSKPGNIDALLAERGYAEEGATLVHTGRLEKMVGRAGETEDVSLELVEEPDDGWLDAHFRCARRSGTDAQNRAEIMRRIEAPAAFASAVIGSEVIAVANGVLERGWLGIYNVVTDPQFRRRGASRALMRLLAEWAIGQGAEHVHLGVEADNPGAIALYRGLGMESAYEYHYRVRRLG